MATDEVRNRCACWFGFCERFPATTRIEFSIEHDARFEKPFVHFEFHMMPVFLRFNEGDNLPLAIDQIDDQRVADWVEERLTEFLNDYLCIDRGQEDAEEDLITDPVCGMRMGRSAAVGSKVYCGHPYFFCSAECLSKFNQDPQDFTQIKVL
jgi:YHS domain-containing protein